MALQPDIEAQKNHENYENHENHKDHKDHKDHKNHKNHKYELFVEIRSGYNLPDRKMIGNHAVYVAVDVGEETKHTKTVEDIENPAWNQKFCFELNTIPEKMELRVRDDRMLLPNLNLGHCTIYFKDKLFNYDASPSSIVIKNGKIPLCDVSSTSTLDVHIVFTSTNIANLNTTSFDSATLPLQSKIEGPFEEVDKKDFETMPKALKKPTEVLDDKQDETMINDNKEVYKLPVLHVQEQPVVIEREVEYIKPVEVRQTIIHRVKPTIIEQPIIVEKHEHYRTPTETVRQEEKVVKEIVDESSVENEDQKIEDLKSRRKAEFNDKTPIIQYEKEQIRLDTNVAQIPTEIREKEVIYEQPIEIERKEIEHIKEKVIEDVKLEKEHIHQKIQPEIKTENVEIINTGDRFYAQDSSALTTSSPLPTTGTTTATATATATNNDIINNNNNNNITQNENNYDMRKEKEIIRE